MAIHVIGLIVRTIGLNKYRSDAQPLSATNHSTGSSTYWRPAAASDNAEVNLFVLYTIIITNRKKNRKICFISIIYLYLALHDLLETSNIERG